MSQLQTAPQMKALNGKSNDWKRETPSVARSFNKGAPEPDMALRSGNPNVTEVQEFSIADQS